ncbi:uncharacterized protein LOC115226976, partial [Octopus sinensis]|uniref:Uncharacterized protein LOC115226976 n=1 Tax=Octopus sinensis TaxID=2607531 RepID=A0A6P7TNV9_9MOLL
MAESDTLFDKNQLLFNLSVPLSALKMVRRPMPPQAIQIEKVDGGGTFTSHPHGNRLNHYHQRHHHHHQQQQQQQGIVSDVAESLQQHQSRLLTDSVTSEIFEQALTLARLDFKQQKRGDDVPGDPEHPTKNSKSSDTKLLTTTPTTAKSTNTTITTATSTNITNKSTTQGVRVIERSSSAKVKNASIQVSRKNTNHLCQNARSPEPTPLSHLPATTDSPPTRDTHDCTRQKFQRIHKDISNCLTDLQTLLGSFIKEGLNESTENVQEAGGSSQDLTIVKVVSRKLYSIKHQAQDLKRQVDHMPKNRGSLLGQQNKDTKYLSNRLASIFQGILRIFLDMCRYLKKGPIYTLNPNMIFVCVVHLVHMLNVLSLLIDIWSEMAHISGKANDSNAVESLHEMIASTK